VSEISEKFWEDAKLLKIKFQAQAPMILQYKVFPQMELMQSLICKIVSLENLEDPIESR
jgi:hypothetical protein